MATQRECEQALRELSAIIAAAGESGGRALRRSVSCRVTDLGVVFEGELRAGRLEDVVLADSSAGSGAGGSSGLRAPKADIALATSSDDLVSLVDGSLGFAAAWSSGRLRVDASIMDLLRLRKML